MSLAIQTFTVDITPPKNTWLCLGFNGQCIGVETPIYLRGVIFHCSQKKYVLVAMEYALLCGESHNEVIEQIADALSLPKEHVIVQTVHQHDVPGIDREVHELMAEYGDCIHDQEYWHRVLADIAHACKQANAAAVQNVTYITVGKAHVCDYASNRRLDDNGAFVWRSSKYQTEELRSLPVGNIDPFLRQTAFYGDSEELLLTLNTYASHPQVADRRQLISSDAPGYALEAIGKIWPQAMHIYFTGCGANIANGKYAGPDPSKEIEVFGEKLADAMQSCVINGERREFGEVILQREVCDLQLQLDDRPIASLRHMLGTDASLTVYDKYMLAKDVFIKESGMKSYPFSMSRLSFGELHWYFLPAEMFLEYQQYINEKHQGGDVMVAAYGDAFLAYVPTQKDFSVGGYELDYCYLTDSCERDIQKLISAFS